MDRTELLRMCQKVARLPNMVYAKNVPENLRVVYDGVEWYPVEYVLWFSPEGEPRHSVTIHSLNAKTTTRVPLEKIEAVKEENK